MLSQPYNFFPARTREDSSRLIWVPRHAHALAGTADQSKAEFNCKGTRTACPNDGQIAGGISILPNREGRL